MADDKLDFPHFDDINEVGLHGIEARIHEYVANTPGQVKDHAKAVHHLQRRVNESDIIDLFERKHTDWYFNHQTGLAKELGHPVENGVVSLSHRRMEIGDDLEKVLQSYVGLAKNVLSHNKQNAVIRAFEESGKRRDDQLMLLQAADQELGVEQGIANLYLATEGRRLRTFDDVYRNVHGLLMSPETQASHRQGGVSRILRRIEGQHPDRDSMVRANESLYGLLHENHQGKVDKHSWRNMRLSDTVTATGALMRPDRPAPELASRLGYKLPEHAYPSETKAA